MRGRDHIYWVYILASDRNGTLYVGVTSDLPQRAWQHMHGRIEGFTKKYKVKVLVYYEVFGDIDKAIAREKTLKRWNRAWKIELIEKHNPTWMNLYDDANGFIAELPGTKFQ
jgi:putative endonuclease